MTTFETNGLGEMTVRTNSFTELQTGVHYWADGQWQESQATIESFPDGAIARRGPHKVIWANNLNMAGAIDLQMPDGQRMQSHILGLGYFDTANGRSVLIAELKDCPGQIVPPNQVIYTNAFTEFAADVRYTYTKAGLEQDVILRERPPPPEDFELDSRTTRLQVLTEFEAAPSPVVRTSHLPSGAGDWLTDEFLDFGAMQMVGGRAFVLEEEQSLDGVAVGKRWLNLDGRIVLVEEVALPALAAALDPLPRRHQTSMKPAGETHHRLASASRRLPERKTVASVKGEMQVAKLTTPAPGVVLDYSTVASATNFIFQADTTYLVSGTVNLGGNTIVEGGTVIKYANTNSARININGTLESQTSAWRPALLTAMDDNSVGETITTNTPTGPYASMAFYCYNLSPPLQIQHWRIAYATIGLFIRYGSAHAVRHAQFVNCGRPVVALNTTAALENLLLCNTSLDAIWAGNSTLTAAHLTVDQANNFLLDGALSLTNSLLVNVTNFSTTFTGYDNATNSGGGVFQAVGAGHHYLADNTYRNLGTTNLSANLLADLALKTTYPPNVLTNTATNDVTLTAQLAWRDTDIPDLGYHYEPLDYLTDIFTVSNATLTVTGGAAIACYNETGIWLQDDSAIVSIGTPVAPNRFVRYQSVQEQPVALGGSSPASAISVNPLHSGSVGPSGTYRFNEFACPAGGGYHLYHPLTSWTYGNLTVQDCALWGGQNDLKGPNNPTVATATLRNNLFHRSTLSANGLGRSTNATLSLSNNLVYGASTVYLRQPGGAVWHAHDNAFDGCTISGSSNLTNSHNAYINGSGRLDPTNAYDVVLTNFTYARGPLGNFYQVSTDLVNTGSVTADVAGLYHYTTQTNQVKETNSTVDIGFHYVACSNGVPLDTDGDGLADYFEDGNGNGSYETGDLFNWTNAFTLTNGLGDLQNYQLSFNVLVNDPAQDYGNEQNSQDETTVIAFGDNVICAYVDSNLGVPGYGFSDNHCCTTNPRPCWIPPGPPQFIGWSVSRDSGTTFTDMGSPPLLTNIVDGITNILGNAGDPILARDNTSGIIYLSGIPQRPTRYIVSTNGGLQTNIYVPIWRSLDNGQTFLPPVNGAPDLQSTDSTYAFADKAMIVVDNFPGQGQGSVCVAFTRLGAMGVTNTLVLYRSGQGGTNWQLAAQLGTPGVIAGGAALAVATNHDLCLAWGEQYSGLPRTNVFFFARSPYPWTNFAVLTNLTLNLTNEYGASHLTRSISSPNEDYMQTPLLPNLVINPANNDLYLVYHDSPPTGTNDKANIYFCQSTNAGTNWSAPIQVNNAATNDQWQPAITLKPDGTKIFIGWHDRREDLASNSVIQTYGVFANTPITGSNSFAAGFVISTTNFPPVFTGIANTNAGTFDPAYPPAKRNDGTNCPTFLGSASHHVGDYDIPFADNSYTYYTWSDRRERSTNATGIVRNQTDIRFIRFSWPQ